MDSIVSSLVRTLKPYFAERLERQADGSLGIRDDELGALASCCTTGQVAAFFVLDYRLHGGDGLEAASGLAANVLRRQRPDGAFGQPYYVKRGDPETVDIAEIGAVANSLYLLHRHAGSEDAKESLIRSAEYLLTEVAAENPGAVYKNPNARHHDVLNGDMYAAHTFARAYELNGDSRFLEQTVRVFRHLIERFGKHEPDWWPYIENWDGSVAMGNSVAYQGIIVAFAHTALPLLPQELRSRWQETAEAAVRRMLASMKEGPHDGNEAPWWCRDWSNVWEIDLAFARYAHIAEAREYAEGRLKALNERLSAEGWSVFTPKGLQHDPERAPVSTTFRKAATFAGILSSMSLDESTGIGREGR
ncbi:hypothetical protein ACFQWB_11920 [Paenibacillus thermoaerophilus]|uniref:Uncharacterized protein n=1 Tax=Paenibacillus thermoaerophilus TaxID=1215385 RepID=A0ABW2V5X0_9BACL|nr:hypothetical protein [Paenibacillus thermoaerophilus]TMV17690.1 hypothetical protein FE781_06040 [Paenibacillus thermoaerophilus]